MQQLRDSHILGGPQDLLGVVFLRFYPEKQKERDRHIFHAEIMKHLIYLPFFLWNCVSLIIVKSLILLNYCMFLLYIFFLFCLSLCLCLALTPSWRLINYSLWRMFWPRVIAAPLWHSCSLDHLKPNDMWWGGIKGQSPPSLSSPPLPNTIPPFIPQSPTA